MCKVSHLSHVSHVIQCDSFCSWFIILNVIGLRFTTLAAFILLLGLHLLIRDLLWVQGFVQKEKRSTFASAKSEQIKAL